MAKIKYISPSPKSGQIEHVQPHIAETLVRAGFAVPVPYKGYVDFLNSEGGNDVSAAPVVEWGVQDRAGTSLHSKVHIIKRTGAETTYFSAPPADCPPSIVARWKALTNSAEPIDMEQVRAREYEQHEKEKVGFYNTMFGSGK